MEPAGTGSVSLEGIPINRDSWFGTFFNDVPIELSALSNPGYTFSYWSGANNSMDPSTTITLNGNASITAVFVENDSPTTLVINEFLAANQSINTDENGDYEDWIEIYNNTNTSIDLNGFYISDKIDNTTKWQFSESFVITSNDDKSC